MERVETSSPILIKKGCECQNMSSYHSNFTFSNKNSKDFGWIIASIEPDDGEMDSGLSQEQIYTDSPRRTRRFLYGTKYDSTPIVKITVLKCNGSDFTVKECRDAYRWLTGNPRASWLSLYCGDELQYQFLGTVQDVKPYKLDARTIALSLYFESISPWAYSPLQIFTCEFGQKLSINDGLLQNSDDPSLLKVDESGVIYNDPTLSITNEGDVYIDNSVVIPMDNQTDDLYTYVNLDVKFTNISSDYLSIKNTTTGEETVIKNMKANEEIILDANQFISSSIPNKIFGDTFNFVWPRLVPGINNIVISGSGKGNLEFSYRHPIKIGDCAMNVLEQIENSDCCTGGSGNPENQGSCYVDERALHEILNEILT